jgi:riboflavin synthase
MFTGIVQGLGRVVALDRDDAVWTFRIQLPNVEGLNIGASVAINGTCLTATVIKGDEVAFDVISETLERTNLGTLEEGHEVNVERSLRMGDELGGHLLSGHIMAVAEIIERRDVGEGVDMKLNLQADVMKYIHEKGYIGLNGASLTIGEVDGTSFFIHLIPETLRMTTFGSLQVGQSINVEIDGMTQTIVATVERMMKQEN